MEEQELRRLSGENGQETGLSRKDQEPPAAHRGEVRGPGPGRPFGVHGVLRGADFSPASHHAADHQASCPWNASSPVPAAPPWPPASSGQSALEKDGKTHKHLPNKTNMWCRQKPCWVG